MTVSPGGSFPLGATVVDGGVNFCVFSREARRLELVLFDGARRSRARPHHRTRGAHAPDLPLLARVRAGPPLRTGLCVPGGGPL